MMVNYSGGFKESVDQIVELEKAGLDLVWVPEAYSFDAISQVGYLAARTERLRDRHRHRQRVLPHAASLMAMTAAGCDYVSDGRFILGLGASGPQVIEGFHGVPYEKPMTRIKEYIDVCRMTWRREPVVYDGETVQVPLPAGQGTGLGKPLKLINHPVRADIPIWWASLMGRSVEATAEHADGWLPIMFVPERYDQVWGRPAEGRPGQARAGARPSRDLRRRHARHRRGPGRRGAAPASSTWPVPWWRSTWAAWGRGARTSTTRRAALRLREGGGRHPGPLPRRQEGRGGRGTCRPSGWSCPTWSGPRSYVKERLGAFKEAGVTVLSVNPVGPTPVKAIEKLRDMVEA